MLEQRSSMKGARLLMLAVTLCAALPITAQAQNPGFVLVVNASNPVTTLTKNQVSDLFLKKVKRWSNGQTVAPIDQYRGKTRDTFSKTVHGRSTGSISAYWQTQIFSGKDTPPPAKTSDDDILEYVRANPNAIGHVTAGTQLGPHLKTVTIKD